MAKDDVPWLLRLIYDFPYAMDLVDDNDFPDHDKIIPALAAAAFITWLFINPNPSWNAMMAWIMAGAYIYGYAAWRLVADAVNQRIARGNDARLPEPVPTEPATPES